MEITDQPSRNFPVIVITALGDIQRKDNGGTHSFGYDSVSQVKQKQKTFHNLVPEVKRSYPTAIGILFFPSGSSTTAKHDSIFA